MEKYLLSFATKEFYRSQQNLILSAKKYGIKNFFSYRKQDLKKTEFYKKNKHILKQKKGAGYWLWKPYYI